MIPESKGLIYSYKDFTEKDKNTFPNVKDTDVYYADTISYMDLNVEELYSFIRKQYNAYKRDLNSDYIYHSKYFFKEFNVKFADEEDDLILINHYSLSGWDIVSKRKDIDDRVLIVSLFSYSEDKRRLYGGIKFMVKVEHIYQLIKDLSHTVLDLLAIENKLGPDAIHTSITQDDVNLYVLPIYVFKGEDHGYIRLSTDCYHSNQSISELHNLLNDINSSLKMFVATNYYMLDMFNSNSKVEVYNEKTNRFSNMTFKAYSSTATSNKKVYAYTDRKMPDHYSPSVEINIDPNRHNILAGTDTPRKLCDYRFMVRGHDSHRWVGTGDNKHLKRVWIDPYEKNKDKPFKIIKETKLK